MKKLWPLLVLSLLLACCPVPAGASVETVFRGRIESLSLPLATAVLEDGREVRLSLARDVVPSGLVPGVLVYVEGVFRGTRVLVQRITIL